MLTIRPARRARISSTTSRVAHRRQQRHLDDEAPRLLLGQVELAGPLAGALADIVEEDVDAPESAPDRAERLADGHRIGPVRGDGQRRPAEALDGARPLERSPSRSAIIRSAPSTRA
jgi:hypothetical protein